MAYLPRYLGCRAADDGVCFIFTLTPQKGLKGLTHCCLPTIGIDPYIRPIPPNALITGVEDLALNAWTLQNIEINPF